MSQEQHDHEVEEIQDALRALGELLERVAYGTIAFGTTYLVLNVGFSVPTGTAVEPSMLNAGIAYYTHAATGAIIRALFVISKEAAARKRRL